MMPVGGKVWFTAAELADLRLPGLPTTKRKINERATDECWALRLDDRGAPLARSRAARGGGIEYHHGVLPASARAALVAKGIAITGVEEAAPVATTSVAQRWQWFEAQAESVRSEARRRVDILARVDAYLQAGLTKSAAISAVAAQASVSSATLWSWLGLVEGVDPANRLPYLAPQRRGGGTEAEIDGTAWQYILSDYLRPEKPTWSQCYRRLIEFATPLALAIPCSRTLYRKLEREVPTQVVVARREGAEALRRTLPPQQRTVLDLHALEAVNIDGHKFDVFVRWPDGRIGRPLMIAIQDLYSRKMLSWRIDESESTLSTRLVFADLFRDWGIPKKCVLDNGRAFAAFSITGGAKSRFRFKIKDEQPNGLLVSLGVEIHWALPYRGQSKPIERAFRDMCDAIAKHPAFAGAYTGNTPLAKPENYGSKAIPIEDFRRVVDAGIAEHNRREGRGTETARGRSFNAVFEESYAVAPIGKASEEQLRLALLTAEDRRCDRTTSVITLEGNRYWSPALSAHSGALLTIRFDPDNLHKEIFAYDREGRFIARAELIEATGFFDKAGANQRRRQESDLKKRVRAADEALQLLNAADLARLVPVYEDEVPARPTVLRPVRHRGQSAAALKLAHHDDALAERDAAQAVVIDRMAQGMRRLRAVE